MVKKPLKLLAILLRDRQLSRIPAMFVAAGVSPFSRRFADKDAAWPTMGFALCIAHSQSGA